MKEKIKTCKVEKLLTIKKLNSHKAISFLIFR